MAYLESYLSGIAVNWFLRLHDSYKNDCSSFVSALKKQFFSQKTAFYAQEGAQDFIKKKLKPYIVTLWKFNVQHLVKNGWCNESAATINLKCNDIFSPVLPKKWWTLLRNGMSILNLL